MHLDLRVPIGLMFAIIGVLLIAFGLTSGDAIYAKSLGINVNVWWGGVLACFGGIMLLLARRGRRGARSA